MAWIRSRRISQSSRASPGALTARFRRCRRPWTLIIEPRFSAQALPGSTTVACASSWHSAECPCAMMASSFARSPAVSPRRGQILAQRHHHLDRPALHAVDDLVEPRPARGEAEQLRPGGVRVSVRGNQQAVGFPGRGTMSYCLDLERTSEPAGQE